MVNLTKLRSPSELVKFSDEWRMGQGSAERPHLMWVVASKGLAFWVGRKGKKRRLTSI